MMVLDVRTVREENVMRGWCFGTLVLLSALFVIACSGGNELSSFPSSEGSSMVKNFGNDLEFLERHVDVLVLTDATGDSRVAIVPQWQGRVMTSSNQGTEGASFGWVNYQLIESGEILPHINVFGGEDRFWLGPEGGQYAIFFEAGSPFDFENWQTPPLIDTEPFELIAVEPAGGSRNQRAVLAKEAFLSNYSGATFNLRIERKIGVLERSSIEELLGVELSSTVTVVGFESVNQLTNVGSRAWTKERGLLSIWILGMYVPSPSTTVLIPYQLGPESELGPVVVDDYFGQVPSERLSIGEELIYFRADGKYRSKIGLPPGRALPVMGSWDDGAGVLTIVRYSKPEQATDYVNSKWEIQEEPYSGDVVNSYNDGPPEPGAEPLGPFYELETSSPAAALSPGKSLEHVHQTFHLTGSREELRRIALEVLGADLDEIPF